MEGMIIAESNPATEVLNRLAQAQTARKQARAKEQLSAITSRIESTLEDYEALTTAESRFSDSSFIGFVDDLKRLESILKDNLQKTEYQRNLALSITDYKQLCSQRYEILTQLSEFFSLYSSELDGNVANTDVYLESLSEGIHETLHDMESILQHLDGSSRNVIDYMNHLHHLSSSKSMKNRKKLEKAIQQNKGEIAKMTEKMQKLNQDLSAREERIEILKTSLDAKKTEINVLKQNNTAEKKKWESKEKSWEEERASMLVEVELLRKELTKKEEETLPVRKIDNRLNEIRDIALNELRVLKTRIQAEKMDIPEIHREIAEHFRVQLQQMRSVHEDELEEWRCELVNHVRQILEIEVNEEDSLKWMQSPDKGKLSSPYHTSSVCSPTKQLSDEENSRPNTELKLQSGDVVVDPTEVPTVEEVFSLRSRLQSMEAMQQEMNNEMLRMQEERTLLLAQIEQLKDLQHATEVDALDALKTLESLSSSRPDENVDSTAQNDIQETEDGPAPDRDGSPSTFSKPPSPTTSRSLVSAYRQKIADRREAINKQGSDLASRSEVETPRLKGMLDSGLLEEHLRSYRAVMGFKDKIAAALSQEAGYQSKAQILSQFSASDYDATQDHVQVHVSRMSSSVEMVLAAVYEQLRSIISTHQDEEDVGALKQQLTSLQEELSRTRGVYERRSQHDAAMIMHMQNTLSETQRGNTTAAGTSGSGFPSSPAAPTYGKTPGGTQLRPGSSESEPTIMFSRQDAEHNEIALKKAATAGKINEDTLQSVAAAMSAYRSIPSRRIRQLASKLVHHKTMKMIETNVRSSNLLTSEVFDVLEKMETLQQRRAQQWSRGMDEMTSERRRLALLLCDAFQRLESITGVFLIKPLISFRGKGPLNKYTGKISTKFNKYEVEAMLKKMLERKKPLPGVVKPNSNRGEHRLDAVMMKAASTIPNQNISVSGLRAPNSTNIWRLDDSLPQAPEKRSPMIALSPPLDLPRLLELDITRQPTRGTPRTGTVRLVKTEEVKIRKQQSGAAKRSSSFQQQRGSDFSRSPDYKSSVPPTTPASPQIMPSPSHISDDDTSVGGLPPIRRPSIRSNITSPRSQPPVTPSKSVANMTTLILASPSPLYSARKDMATSPGME